MIMQLKTVRQQTATPSFGLGRNLAHIPLHHPFYPPTIRLSLGWGHHRIKALTSIHINVLISSQTPMNTATPSPPQSHLFLLAAPNSSTPSSASATQCLNPLRSSPSPEHTLEQEGGLRQPLSCSVSPLLSCQPTFTA